MIRPKIPFGLISRAWGSGAEIYQTGFNAKGGIQATRSPATGWM